MKEKEGFSEALILTDKLQRFKCGYNAAAAYAKATCRWKFSIHK